MSAVEELGALLRVRLLQLCALTVLLTGVGVIAFQLKYCVLDFDIWWHLKVGDWIIEHLAVPHTGILSRTVANRPWVAYSWGYEVLLSRVYAWFGLVGIGVFGALLTIAVAYAVYWMLLRLSGQFWLACIGTGVVCSAFLFNAMPRPFFFSIVLYSVTLTLLLEANRRGRVQTLYWLPLVFVVWANLHIQFIYGLFLVGLLMAVCLVQRLMNRLGIAPGFLLVSGLPSAKLAAIFAACVLATLIGPNFYHPYVAVYAYSKAKFTYSIIIELQPLTFRGYSHYAELLLAAAGFFAVGWQKKLDPFKVLLLAVATLLAFRTMRDAWFICVSAAACAVDFSAPEAQRDRPETWPEKAGVAAALTVLLLLFSNGTDFNQRGLDRAISANYPVNAVNFLRRNPVPGMLYNNLNWGGFLMWYMPEYPVAVDGRNDLYGDELDRLFFNSEIAAKSYMTDPYLNEASVILLGSELPLAKILTVDPRFQLIYRDQIATVYARR
ncbi:MAG: hypothetical protein ABSD96_11880 [Candidatus Korobacteraceae bacterium]